MAAPAFWIILKRNDVGDWAQFAEIFGQPIREGIYPAFDEEARQKLIEDIVNMGGSAAYVHPENTNLKLIEATNKTGSVDVYEKLALFCNSEISKVVLGNTLTTEVQDKGTQALGEVQQEGEKDISFFVKRRLLNILNYEVTDTWANLGFDTRGGKFSFVPPKAKNLSQKILIDHKLKMEMNLPMSDDYLYDTYDIPRPENYEELKQQMEERRIPPIAAPPAAMEDSTPATTEGEQEKEKKQRKTITNALKDFFG
jgi:Mu-like prophage protein gp29